VQVCAFGYLIVTKIENIRFNLRYAARKALKSEDLRALIVPGLIWTYTINAVEAGTRLEVGIGIRAVGARRIECGV
jgi:hypothetical protein